MPLLVGGTAAQAARCKRDVQSPFSPDPHSYSRRPVLTKLYLHIVWRRKKAPADDFSHQMLLLLLELMQSDLPELAVGGAWDCVNEIMLRGSEALGLVALEADICGIGMTHLRTVGCAADWMVS